jgi:hypothetical protein
LKNKKIPVKKIIKDSVKLFPESVFLRLKFQLGYIENLANLKETFPNDKNYLLGKFYARTKEVKKAKRRPA